MQRRLSGFAALYVNRYVFFNDLTRLCCRSYQPLLSPTKLFRTSQHSPPSVSATQGPACIDTMNSLLVEVPSLQVLNLVFSVYGNQLEPCPFLPDIALLMLPLIIRIQHGRQLETTVIHEQPENPEYRRLKKRPLHYVNYHSPALHQSPSKSRDHFAVHIAPGPLQTQIILFIQSQRMHRPRAQH